MFKCRGITDKSVINLLDLVANKSTKLQLVKLDDGPEIEKKKIDDIDKETQLNKEI